MSAIPSALRRLAGHRELLDDALAGLARRQKTLPSKYFYDARGSDLFVEITNLPEYYPTRTEIALLHDVAGEIARQAADTATVVEYGSGDGRKSVQLLKALPQVKAYVPVEISPEAMAGQTRRLADAVPQVAVSPLVADFTKVFTLPASLPRGARLGFFPGSTIGNLKPVDAVDLLRQAAAILGPGSRFLLGIDLKKPLDILLPAYNDQQGVTAAFNLNLLDRLNREAEASFDISLFRHEARYNADHGRIEMHLVSLKAQQVEIAGRSFAFTEGESIHTENSYKYTPDEAKLLARAGDWDVLDCFIDKNRWFALLLLTAGA